MQSSHGYPYDEPQAPIPSYPTSVQRSHPVSVGFSTASQGLNRSPYDELRAPYYSQQQHHATAPTGIHPREGAYVPVQTSQSNQYLAAAPYREGLPVSGERQSYPGYLYETPYTQPSQYPTASQIPVNQDVDRRRFIPTPSEMAQAYPNYASSSRPMVPMHPSFTADSHHPSRSPRLHSPSANASVPTTHPSAHGPSTAPAGSSQVTERYPCEKCGKTFSRSHDRKRHYETQHHPVPIIHRCRFCEKEFSRADSLKRHIDNGCDEMP